MTLEALLEQAAFTVLELVIDSIPVTESYCSLKVPALSENPLISVSDTRSCSPALITDCFLGSGEPCRLVESVEYLRNRNRAEIELSVVCIYAHEMTVERFTEPITDFGTYKKMLQLPVYINILIKSPRIIATFKIERKAVSHTYLKTKIRR
jgi:hypothetical protein